MNKILLILIIPFISALLGYYIGRKKEKIRDVFHIITCSITFLLIILIYPDLANGNIEYSIPNIMGTGLHLKIDIFRYSLIFITGFAWFLTTIYSTQYLIKYKNRNRYYMFFMLTYGFTLGIFMSANILNLFTFFEGMSFTSYALIIHDEDRYSHEAGISYLAMAVAGGMVLLMGIFLAYDSASSLEISEMAKVLPFIENTKKYVIAGLIIFGFGIKASMFPLHTWLPKAYAAAPSPATAILSAILLKTGIFGIIITLNVLLAGDVNISYVIFFIGMINIIFGGVLALMQRNIKRIIAYSSMSQTGFIFLGIGLIGILGEHGGIAIIGTIMYILNHALFKLLLFLGAGIIYMILNEMSLNHIWGFGKNKIKLKIVFLVGVLGIIGFPGFSGYISKTLIHEAIIEGYHLTGNNFFRFSEYVFFIGGGLTTAYMMKLFIALFMKDNKNFTGNYKERIKKRAFLPLVIISSLIVLIGIFPKYIIKVLSMDGDILGYHIPNNTHYFSGEPLLYSLITLTIGVLIYVIFVRERLFKRKKDGYVFLNPSLIWFSIEDNFYKPVFKKLYVIFGYIFKIIDSWVLNSVKILSIGFAYIGNYDIARFDKFKIESILENIENKRVEKKENIKNNKEIITDNISKKIGDIKVGGDKISDNISKKIDLEKDKINKNSNKIKEEIINFNFKITNLTYSVFIFGFVLVVSLLFIFIKVYRVL